MPSLSENLSIRLVVLWRGLFRRAGAAGRRLSFLRHRPAAGLAVIALCATAGVFALRGKDAPPADPQDAPTPLSEIEFGRFPPVVVAGSGDRGDHSSSAPHSAADWHSPMPMGAGSPSPYDSGDPSQRPVRSAHYERPASNGGGVWLTGTIEDTSDRRATGD